MQAAMRLALRGGFSAMTVRQIAREAQVAAGQLHHHFASIGELKSQVFIRLIREMLDMPLVAEDASWRERLFSMIGSEDGRLEPYIRLWREGQVLADSDPDIKAAYLLTMTMWHAGPWRSLSRASPAVSFIRPSRRRISPGVLSPWCAASTGFTPSAPRPWTRRRLAVTSIR